MAGEEEKVYSETEHKILSALDSVKLLQELYYKSFNDHVKDDDSHFQRLYDTDEKILAAVNKVPEDMLRCRDKIKTDTLQVARKELNEAKETLVSTATMETYKGSIAKIVAEIKGSLKTTYIIMGIFQAVLLIFLAAWVKTNGV